jgi:hypothetical protein
MGASSVFYNEWLFLCVLFYVFLQFAVADRSEMAAILLSSADAMRVERCGFAT